MRRQGTKQKMSGGDFLLEKAGWQERTSESRVGKEMAIRFTSSPTKCTRCSAVRCYESVCSFCVLCHLLLQTATFSQDSLLCYSLAFACLFCFSHLNIFSFLLSSALLPSKVVSSFLPSSSLLCSSLLQWLSNLREESYYCILVQRSIIS